MLCRVALGTQIVEQRINSEVENIVLLKPMNSSLWKRVIAWERSRAASVYGIIWGDAGQNKHGGI